MKSWFAAVLAALAVIVAGTALASVPNGSSTSFNVEDPAVTVIAAGQTDNAEGINENCQYESSGLEYCFPINSPDMTVTPTRDGVCKVDLFVGLYGDPFLKESGNLTGVHYGLAARIGPEEEEVKVDENGVGTSPTYQSAQTTHRSRLVPVEAGESYTFGWWIEANGSTGTGYYDMVFVCFGA